LDYYGGKQDMMKEKIKIRPPTGQYLTRIFISKPNPSPSASCAELALFSL
jgi:hypothetical protein